MATDWTDAGGSFCGTNELDGEFYCNPPDGSSDCEPGGMHTVLSVSG